MAVQIPTLIELFTSIKGDLENKVGVTIPLFGKSYLNGVAAVQAAKLKLVYLAIANVQKNVFPDLAESEAIGGTLERFGRAYLKRSPFAAKSGYYNITVTGQIGATIPVNTTYKSDDDSINPSKLYILDTAFTFVGTTGVINVRATEGGLDSLLEVGNTLTSTAPLLNADEIATVLLETIPPLSAEDLEDYREKILTSITLETQGGSVGDYRIWSFDAQGVKKVYPYAKSGFSNEISLFVEATIADSTDGKGTPTALILSDVEAVIEFDPDTTAPLNERGRRPMTVLNIDVTPVSIKEIDVIITGFIGGTAAIETIIFNAIKLGIDNIRPFISAADVLSDKNDILNNSNITFFLLNAQTSIFDSLIFKVDGVTVSSKTFTNGDIPFLNSVTYV